MRTHMKTLTRLHLVFFSLKAIVMLDVHYMQLVCNPMCRGDAHTYSTSGLPSPGHFCVLHFLFLHLVKILCIRFYFF